MSNQPRIVGLFLLFSLLSANLPLSAQPTSTGGESEPVMDQSNSVTVNGTRSPLEFPYLRAYEAAVKANSVSEGRAQLVFRLLDKRVGGAPDLRLWLEYEDRIVPIDLDNTNGFVLVPDAQAVALKATLVVNRQRREVAVQVDVQPRIRGDKVTVGDLERSISAARAIRASLLPWYARIVTPTVNAVRICSVLGDARFEVVDETGGHHPLESFVSRDIQDRSARCTDVADSRNPYSESSLVIFPPGSSFDYVGSIF